MGWNKRILNIVGAWPEVENNIFDRYRTLFCALWIALFIYFPQTAGVVVVWGDMDTVIELLSINGTIFIAIVKIIALRHYREG